MTITRAFRGIYLTLLLFVIVTTIILLPKVSIYNSYKKLELNNLAWVNYRVRQLYGERPFVDTRLDVLNYTILPASTMCQNVDFIVVAHVRVGDLARRQRWRKTYGSTQFKEKFRYGILFSMGKENKIAEHYDLQKKAMEYRDILQANFLDTYRNITLKHLAELRYISTVCSEDVEIVRMDDDVVWNIQKLSRFASTRPKNSGLYCSKCVNHTPIWKSGDKRALIKGEWNATFYPPHCLGMVYFASVEAARRMLGVVHLQSFFWIDDVFVTGVLTESANVSITDIGNVLFKWVRHGVNGETRRKCFHTLEESYLHSFFEKNQMLIL